MSSTSSVIQTSGLQTLLTLLAPWQTLGNGTGLMTPGVREDQQVQSYRPAPLTPAAFCKAMSGRGHTLHLLVPSLDLCSPCLRSSARHMGQHCFLFLPMFVHHAAG